MSSKYWEDRRIDEIKSFSDKKRYEIEKQLISLYKESNETITAKMQILLTQLLEEAKNGKTLSIGDLYQYNRYYKMIGQINNELKSLGSKEIKILDKELLSYAKDISVLLANTYELDYDVADIKAAKAIVERVWAPDGKQYSERVWEDKAKLLNVLQQGLFNVIVNGESNTKLAVEVKNIFSKEFAIAKRLVNTEITYIQNATALDRYKKSGLTQYKYFTLSDDKVCSTCQKLDKQIYNIDYAKIGENCPPIHPNCRCFISPVVNLER